jgi:PhnB protein
MELTPYMIFGGRCRDAFTTYAEILGGTITTTMPWNGSDERLRHCRLEVRGEVLHGMDAERGERVQDTALMLALDTPEEAERVFAALMAGGEQAVPMGPTPFAARFGMGVDRFGIRWMITAGPGPRSGERDS